jgi:hypothetical protein
MTKHANVRHDVEQLIGLLGDNARDVSEYLKSQGIRGTPRDSRDCVIARYLMLVTTSDPRVRSIFVLQDAVRILLTRPAARPVTISLPIALQDFILLFDASHLPDLEDHSDDFEPVSEGEVPQLA